MRRFPNLDFDDFEPSFDEDEVSGAEGEVGALATPVSELTPKGTKVPPPTSTE
ncbi:unnamed protein product, partial [Ilex paraguariensis]